MHALAASCEELRARTGKPPLDKTSCYKCNGTKREKNSFLKKFLKEF